jgi:hypothetical protein
MPVAGPVYAEDARVEELEGYNADERMAVAGVQFQARRQPRPQQGRGHGVGGQEQVAPLGGQEGAGHGRLHSTEAGVYLPSAPIATVTAPSNFADIQRPAGVTQRMGAAV